ncbi:hypothetical protein CRYUN_Cryun32bG0077400 [Craigia yunnanensis]
MDWERIRDYSNIRFLIRVKSLAKVMAEGEEDLPRDAKIVKSLLKSMGVEDYEPRVIHQFLELWYRYVVDVLLELARNRNKVPLPKAKPGPGILLPHAQDTLISTNYQFVIPKKQSDQARKRRKRMKKVLNLIPRKSRRQIRHTQHLRVSFPLTKRAK